MNLRQRSSVAADRFLGAMIALTLGGSVLAFGGRVWWAPMALAIACGLIVVGTLFRVALDGRVRLLKSPLSVLGLLTLGLAACQIVPLPGEIARRLSPASQSAYSYSFLPDRARVLDAAVVLPEAPTIRSPVSVDRSSTLRWLAGAMGCLAVFWAVSRYTDRLRRLYLVWGSIVAAFFLNTGFVAVQLACNQSGLFGYLEPGHGPVFGPSPLDSVSGPGTSSLRAANEPRPGRMAWALPEADRTFALGTQMGGAGAYLALGSLGLPLALGLTLQFMAPRGSRDTLSGRLRDSGQGSLVLLMATMSLTSALLIGVLAGPWLTVPFAVGLILAGLPGARATGLRGLAVGLTALGLLSLCGGAALGEVLARSTTMPAVVPQADMAASVSVWGDALRILPDFPIVGTGLGTFATIYPLYKSVDVASSTAMSSAIQWGIETGVVGLAIVGLGVIWCLLKLPGAIRRVGTADRSLVFGLIGAASAFTLFSTVHWTIELLSVALAASAVAGAGNRWLAGGTDLFIERG